MDPNQSSKQTEKPEDSHSTEYAPYPKIDPTDVAPPPATPAGENWTSVPVGSQPEAPPPPAVGQPMYTAAARSSNDPPQGSNAVPGGGATTMPSESNPYVSPGPVPASTTKSECLVIYIFACDRVVSYWVVYVASRSDQLIVKLLGL